MHEPGQDHVLEPVPGARREGHVARPRQPAELLPEDVERDQAEPEDRRRDRDQREPHGGAVGERASLERRDDADRDAHEEPEHGCAQRKLRRDDGSLLHLVEDRCPRVEGQAEPRPAVLVAGEQPLHVERVLHRPRLVQAELVLDLGDQLGGRRPAREGDRRVHGRQEVEDAERHEGDDQHHQDHPETASDHVPAHGLLVRRARSPRRPGGWGAGGPAPLPRLSDLLL